MNASSSAYAVIDGVRIHYLRSGSGPAMLFLHGWPQTSREWHKILPAFADRYTTIALDMPGLGESEPLPGGYAKRDVAEVAYALVRQLGFERMFVVGHDLGVGVAYALAALHPEAVERVALLDAPPPLDLTRLGALWHVGFHMSPKLPETLVAGREREYLTFFYGKAYPGAMTDEDVEHYVSSYARPGAMHEAFEYYRAFKRDVRDNAEFAKTKLAMPVLAIGGANSPLGGMASAAMQHLANDVRSETVADSGHWIPEERPKELTALLASFFDAAPSQRHLAGRESA